MLSLHGSQVRLLSHRDFEMFLSWLHTEKKLDISFRSISVSRLWFVAQSDFVLLCPPEKIFDMLFMSVHERLSAVSLRACTHSLFTTLQSRQRRRVDLEARLEETDLNKNVF